MPNSHLAGGTAGQMCIFTVKFKIDEPPPSTANKEDLVVYVECAGDPPKVTIMGGPGWSFVIGLTPQKEGLPAHPHHELTF